MTRQFLFRPLFVIGILYCAASLEAQDFILQGCYWDCPDDATAEVDPAAFNFWVGKVRDQAPALRHAGFSYVWLPSFFPGQEAQVISLVDALRESGMSTFMDIDLNLAMGTSDSIEAPLRRMNWLRRDLRIEGFRFTSAGEITPATLHRLLEAIEAEAQRPQLLAVKTTERQSPHKMADYLHAIETAAPRMSERMEPGRELRVFDYPLREQLRRACSQPGYDVRQLFDASIRDRTALSGFKVITFVNSPEFYNPNGMEGDADDLIREPLLAYAYLLTNNQLGLPAVFYGDYFGPDSEIEYFLDRPPLREEMDQLIKTHREFIYQATSIEYLNRLGTERRSHYRSGSAERALIYQIDGSNTPAGQATPSGSKDVLVAINFSDTTLQVFHEVNPAHVEAGDRFTDILGRSNQPEAIVGVANESGVPNAVYLDLPPRSYSIWVHGKAEKVLTSPIDFSAEPLSDYIELSWEVADERNIRIYRVERSINGGQFKNLEVVKAAGADGEAASYLFVDDNIFPNETLYYRIKAVSADGRFESSPVEAIRIPREEWQFELHAKSPAVHLIQVESNFEDRLRISVFNADGARIQTETTTLQKGLNEHRIDLSGQPRGIYFIEFSTGREKKWVERIVKL